MGSLERFAFYERAKKAYAIVLTSELRPYGNFVIRKGVIFG
jgi:L-fucose mutarotase